jgi:hypothetical protein
MELIKQFLPLSSSAPAFVLSNWTRRDIPNFYYQLLKGEGYPLNPPFFAIIEEGYALLQ